MKVLALKINKRIYYGWMMVFISGFAFFMSSPGQTYSISVFIHAYQEKYGFSSTLISSGYSFATLISGLLIVFMGKSVDRFGARRMLIIAGVCLGLTAFYHSFVSNIVMIFIGFFLLRYFGQGSMTLIPSSIVPQWFEKRRAFAISIASMGGLLATLIIPAFNLWLITSIGVVYAWRVISAILLIGFIPIVYIFAVNKPEDLGMTIENGITKSEEEVIEALRKIDQESFTLTEAMKTKQFWIAGLISTIASMFSTGITFHFFKMMALRNISSEHAALIIGLIAIPAFLMPLIARIVIDKYQVRYIFIGTLIMVILSMGFLAFAVNNVLTASLFMLFYGTAIAIQMVALNVLWPNYFGRKYLGSIRGGATVFMVLGSALGPLPFGISYDLTGGYISVIIGMMIYTIITLLLSFSLKKPIKILNDKPV